MAKKLLIILLIVVVAGGVILGYFWWQKKGEKESWRTYRNKEYGFEIKYPKSWYVHEDSTFGFAVISTFSQRKYEKYYKKIDEEKLGENYGVIHISYFEERSLEAIFESIKTGIERSMNLPVPAFKVEGLTTEEININGSRGHKIYYRKKYPAEAFYEEGTSVIYLFLDRDEEDVIRFEGEFKGKAKNRETYEEYADIFNQMLSTFKFIEVDGTADWKTYRNEEYGFEIKYPKEWEVKTTETSILFTDVTKTDILYPDGLVAFTINILDTPFNSIHKYFEEKFQDRPKESVPEYAELIVNNTDALRFFDPISMGGCPETIIFLQNSKLYELNRTGPTCEYSDELFNQMLSTFKFIE